MFFSETLNPWVGLKAESNTELFKWEDGTNVVFTYWARNQPPMLQPNTTGCVVLSDLVSAAVVNRWFTFFKIKNDANVNDTCLLIMQKLHAYI